MGKIVQAKNYIDKALALVNTHKILEIDKANTFLNSCSILAAMGRHARAADDAFQAIEYSKSLENNDQKTVYALACFNYATEKKGLKDLKES